MKAEERSPLTCCGGFDESGREIIINVVWWFLVKAEDRSSLTWCGVFSESGRQIIINVVWCV